MGGWEKQKQYAKVTVLVAWRLATQQMKHQAARDCCMHIRQTLGSPCTPDDVSSLNLNDLAVHSTTSGSKSCALSHFGVETHSNEKIDGKLVLIARAC